MPSHRVPALGAVSFGVLVMLALLAGGRAVCPAADLDVDVGAYAASNERAAFGAVSGRASALARKPSEPDPPLAGVDVVLVPRSAALVSRLEEIKRLARASAEDYVDAVPEVQKAEQGLEARLKLQGAGHLVRRVKTTEDGTFTVADLPSGDWLLIASRSVSVTKHPRPPKPTTSRREKFDPPSQLTGYASVSIWIEELRLSPGKTEQVELTDRNAWLSGIAEKRQTPPRKLRPLFD